MTNYKLMQANNDSKEDQLNEWTGLKFSLHLLKGGIRNFREGEVWWVACGENIGVEINGKNNAFSRPVIVIKKLGKYSFIGLPMTSQPKTGSWYININFQQRNSWVVLCQIRTFSTNRMYRRMGRLDEADMMKIRKGLKGFLGL